MLPALDILRTALGIVIDDKERQGHVVTGLREELAGMPDGYDAMAEFARRVADLPLREDWPYIEPSDLEGIWAECDPSRPLGPIAEVDLEDASRRAEAAFLASVCGCILGKPFEINPTLDELREALEPTGEWPLRDYPSEQAVRSLRMCHPQWIECVRERIRYVAPDDDINYRIIAMLLLEEFGTSFTSQHVRETWLWQLPVRVTFGPERTLLAKSAMASIWEGSSPDLDEWVRVLNPMDEFCGAMIRVDPYGYACPGNPALAAELAWRDSSFTHRRTGIYGSMFAAAAIATAMVERDRLAIFDTALKFVPRKSRFHEIVADCLAEVRKASDWQDGYWRIHLKYGGHDHCRIYQETGTLINTMRFAEDAGHGICIQVSQGNDTDCYGATAGSLLGAFFGPGSLEPRWLEPFNDEMHVALALFFERSLSRVAKRMGALPKRIAAGITGGVDLYSPTAMSSTLSSSGNPAESE
ncbi:MAG: ADP-ribosylglycohydrolase family protein [Actinomycetota bacterium]